MSKHNDRLNRLERKAGADPDRYVVCWCPVDEYTCEAGKLAAAGKVVRVVTWDEDAPDTHPARGQEQ